MHDYKQQQAREEVAAKAREDIKQARTAIQMLCSKPAPATLASILPTNAASLVVEMTRDEAANTHRREEQGELASQRNLDAENSVQWRCPTASLQ